MRRVLQSRISRRLLTAVAAGTAGLLLSALPIDALSRLWIGRTATLSIAILYGPWYGLLATAVMCLRGWPAIGVFGPEAMLVGLCAWRRHSPPLLVGALFWAAGAVIFIAVQLWSGVPPATALPLGLQRFLYGMVAVIVADLITMAVAGRWVSDGRINEPRRLQAYAFHGFVVASILPVLLLSTFNGELSAARQESDGGARLVAAATSTRDRIRDYLELHTRAIESLAATLSAVDPRYAASLDLMQGFRRQYASLDTITTVDPAGRMIVTTDDLPPDAPLRLRGVADRQYFVDAMRTHRTAVSDIVVSRATGEPTMVMATPYYGASGVAGLACGILNLPRLQTVIDRYQSTTEGRITVVDRRSQVIYASPLTGRHVMQDLSADPVMRASANRSSGLFQYGASTRPTPARDLDQFLVAVAEVDGVGWKVLVEQPLVGLRLQTTKYYLLTLTLVGLAFSGAVFGAGAFAKAVSRPLEQLVAVVRSVSSASAEQPAPVDRPATPITEVAQLIED